MPVPDPFSVLRIRFIFSSAEPHKLSNLPEFTQIKMIRQVICQPDSGKVFRFYAGPGHGNLLALGHVIRSRHIGRILELKHVSDILEGIKGVPLELECRSVYNRLKN